MKKIVCLFVNLNCKKCVFKSKMWSLFFSVNRTYLVSFHSSFFSSFDMYFLINAYVYIFSQIQSFLFIPLAYDFLQIICLSYRFFVHLMNCLFNLSLWNNMEILMRIIMGHSHLWFFLFLFFEFEFKLDYIFL